MKPSLETAALQRDLCEGFEVDASQLEVGRYGHTEEVHVHIRGMVPPRTVALLEAAKELGISVERCR